MYVNIYPIFNIFMISTEVDNERTFDFFFNSNKMHNLNTV